MALIEPNTLVSFVWGAHFYNTHHDGSDYDIVSVVLQDIEDVLSGITYRPKQKHKLDWLGNKIDITRYELSHFLDLIAKGNIQLIELVLGYDPQYVIYYSKMWKEFVLPMKHFANDALNHTQWGHIKGWLHKTMKKVDVQGMTIKRAALMYRMVIEMRTWIKENKLIFKWPEIIEYAEDNYEASILDTIYNARKGLTKVTPEFLITIEEVIHEEIDNVLSMLEEYIPPSKDLDMISRKQQLLNVFRTDQIRELGRDYWFGY